MRRNAGVLQRLAAVSPDECAISSVTRYELLTGVEKCADSDRERNKVELIFSTVAELTFDKSSAAQSAVIRAALEQLGTPIGP
jgi:tRNA(fMet)-specific endonuclease VapC